LFGGTRQRVLGFLFGQPDRSFFASELIQIARAGSGAVQRELARLVQSGLITSELVGRQRHYRANPASPIFDELQSIVMKTGGIPAELRSALDRLKDRISLAFIYGSIAKNAAHASSDIDLMIVGDDLSLEEVFSCLASAEARLARKISPTLYSSDEFRRRQADGNSFLTKVISGPTIPLWGELNVDPTTR
jgi:predicted nucleotidyltransferase